MERTTVSPVLAARGLLWLAEQARDAGVLVVGLQWTDVQGVGVQVEDLDALHALADRLGLPSETRLYGDINHPTAERRGAWLDMHPTAERRGAWREMSVYVFGGAR